MMTMTVGRVLRSFLPLAAAALLLPLPQAAHAQSTNWARSQALAMTPLQREIAKRAKDLNHFYRARDNQPLWLDAAGRPTGAAEALLSHLKTAEFDGVDGEKLRPDRLAKLLDKARRGDEDNQAEADIELSRAFAAYARAMLGAKHEPMIYENEVLQPVVLTAREVLDDAAEAGSLEQYVAEMRWMHPFYAPLRASMADPQYSEIQRKQIWTNLARIRAIPGSLSGKHVLVDAAGARLWMYEDGKPVDSMKVVVGKPALQTPMMAGFIRYAIVNPYWNVPPDLVQTNIAANVLAKGVKYLKAGGYQVLSDWSDAPKVLDPKKIDWKAVHEGRVSIRVRQLPGGDNFMGKVKYMFPNAQGIYLHDTPDKQLLNLDARQLSSGCVRLEDAERLGQWLMKGPLPTSKTPEKKVALPDLVPVYITYLTAAPEPGGTIAFRDDPYARDGFQLAAAETRLAAAERP